MDGGVVFSVVERAGIEAQAPASDASVEFVLHLSKQLDSFVEQWLPALGEAGPVAAGRCPAVRKCCERVADLPNVSPIRWATRMKLTRRSASAR
jgi:hypothetical protein